MDRVEFYLRLSQRIFSLSNTSVCESPTLVKPRQGASFPYAPTRIEYLARMNWQRSGDLRNEAMSFFESGITGKRLQGGARNPSYRRARPTMGLGLSPAADLSQVLHVTELIQILVWGLSTRRHLYHLLLVA
jgi:hypothetical protein